MIGEILLSILIPFCAWVAYGRLLSIPNLAFRWGVAHVVAFAWLQLGAQIFLSLGIATPITMGAWILLSLLWIRPCSLPKIPEMGLYLCLVTYFILALMPPWYRDSLTYHLTLPKLFAQNQGYTAGDEIIFGYFPLGWHSILSYLYVFSPEEGVPLFNPRLVAVWLSGATAIATSGLCRMLGGTQLWSIVAGVCFLLIPTQIEFGTSAYIQTWLTLICVCAAGFVHRKDFVWMGLCAGLAASAKYSGLFLCLLVCIIALRSKKVKYPIIPMILVGTWFYLRNLWLKGNPLFPLAYSLFGGDGWDETRAEMYAQTLNNYGMGKESLDYLLLWPRVFFTQDLILFFQGSLGPVVGIITVIAIWNWRRHTNLLILGCGWGILWMFQVQQVRFLMPCVPIFIAIGLGVLGTNWAKISGCTLIISMMVWLFAPFQSLATSLHPTAKPLLDAPLPFLWKRQLTYFGRILPQEEMMVYMHHDLGVLINTLSEKEDVEKVWLVWCRGFTYSIPHPFRVDSVFGGWRWEQELSKSKTTAEWRKYLKEEGISHVLINTHFFQMSIEDQIEAKESFHRLIREKVLIVDLEIENMALYVVDWESDSESESGRFNNPQNP